MFDGSTGADMDVVYDPRAEFPTGTSRLHHGGCVNATHSLTAGVKSSRVHRENSHLAWRKPPPPTLNFLAWLCGGLEEHCDLTDPRQWSLISRCRWFYNQRRAPL